MAGRYCQRRTVDGEDPRSLYFANSRRDSVMEGTPFFLTKSTFLGGDGHARERRSLEGVST